MKAKHTIETMLCRVGAAGLARLTHRGDTLVLSYHNIVPLGERAIGDSSLHLSQRVFGQQLDALQQTHEIVSLSDALLHEPTSRRPRATVTFDDAYCGAVTAGVEELRSRGLPATVFVTPRFVGCGFFWWDVLASRSEGLSKKDRDRCLWELWGSHDAIMEWVSISSSSIVAGALPSHQACATFEQLCSAAAIPGIDFASHAWSHANLAALKQSEVRDELKRSLHWLNEHFRNVRAHLAYPYGLANRKVEEATRFAGYEAGFMISGGWWKGPTRTHDFAVPRLNVPAGISLDGFRLRVSGIRLR